MQQTQNYKLNKPDITDYAKIELLNENADIVDAKLKDLEINGDLSRFEQTVSDLDNEVTTHFEDKNNPHGVTAVQIGATSTQDFTAHSTDLVSHGIYGTVTGTNTLEMTNGKVTAYVEGMLVAFKNTTANTGSVTLNINSLGDKTVKKSDGSNLSSGNLKAGGIYQCRYDGVNFILLGEGGGEYGTAVASDVLAGKTIGTENGLVTGTISNLSGTTQTGTRRAQASGYVDASFPAGYYDGATTTRVRLSDGNFTAANIRSGASIFGLSGTFAGTGWKMASGMNPDGDHFFEVRGLGFKPRIILGLLDSLSDSVDTEQGLYTYVEQNLVGNSWIISHMIRGDGGTYSNPTIYADGFNLGRGWSDSEDPFYWIALG